MQLATSSASRPVTRRLTIRPWGKRRYWRNFSGVWSGDGAITPEKGPVADLWHTDLSYLKAPPAFGIIYNVVGPPVGGGTMWSSSYAVYDALSPPVQRLCSELKALHSPGAGIYNYVKTFGGEEKLARVDRELGRTEHPLAIRHPHTGRTALYITGHFMERIIGLTPQEEATLLLLLRAHYDNPNFQARMRWSPGCMAIWDQRATNHRGQSDHYPAHPYRTMKSTFVSDGIAAASLALRHD